MPTSAFTLASDVSPAAAGGPRFVLRGRLTLADGGQLWEQLRAALPAGVAVEVDLGGVERLDGGAAALLQAIACEHEQGGGEVRYVGAPPGAGRILALYAGGASPCDRPEPGHDGLLHDIGTFAVNAVEHTRAILGFLGDLVAGLGQAVRRPRTVHLDDLAMLIERAGADGMPIVALINFLIGAILGLQGAMQLHRFGGDPFLANLVGLSVVRELGPLMTAILVTGRSGAAYAAELGTMRVNEEVDALRTLGQDPQRFLVFPRVLALLVALPLLTVIGDLIGILGGLALAVTYLDQPPVVYMQSLQRAVGLLDVGTGVIKSGFFAIAIGLIACQRGLAARGGAAGVGGATTSAVVVVLFSLVTLDAVFTWVFSLLGW